MIITCASLARDLPKPKHKIEFINSADRVTFTDNVIASTGFNKNKTFFQIANFLKYKDKLSSIVFNFNHDLSITNNQYLGNKTKMLDLDSRINGGEFEIISNEIVSTDPEVINRADKITSYSTELSADEIYFFENDEGVYANNFDWFGLAFLTGELPNLSGSRVGSVQYNKKDKQAKIDISSLKLLNKNIMDKKQFLEFLNSKEGKEIINNSEVSKVLQSLTAPKQTIDNSAIVEELTKEITNQVTKLGEELKNSLQPAKPEFAEGETVKAGQDTFVVSNSKYEKLELVEGEYLRTGVTQETLENAKKVELKETVETAEEYVSRKTFENSMKRAKLPPNFKQVENCTTAQEQNLTRSQVVKNNLKNIL